MIPIGVEIFVARKPIDLRSSFERLSGIVREAIGRDPRGRAMFVFFGRRRDAIKVLFHDGSGFCIFYKRLDRGVFRVPGDEDDPAEHITLEAHELDALLDGIDVEKRPPRRVLH